MTQKRTEAPRLLEKDIQKTCTDLLELDGWRLIRTDMPHLRGLGVQEPGMADSLYIRYTPFVNGGCGKLRCAHCNSMAEVLFIEWKRQYSTQARGPRVTKAALHQKAWHAAERARGALTLIAGEDFPATIGGFSTWYSGSGLAKKVHPV